MRIDGLTFDHESHTYYYAGNVVPNVTSILAPLINFDGVPFDVLTHAMERGTAVHKACELHLLGELDESTLDEEVAPYFYQFIRFLNHSSFKCMSSEFRVYSGRSNFAGTVDLYGKISRKLVLIDIKTPVVMPRSTGPQTAAYRYAIRESENIHPRKLIHRYGLKLQPDKYELVPFDDEMDFTIFLAAKSIYHWRNAK